jgi:hypothetical protein
MVKTPRVLIRLTSFEIIGLNLRVHKDMSLETPFDWFQQPAQLSGGSDTNRGYLDAIPSIWEPLYLISMYLCRQ